MKLLIAPKFFSVIKQSPKFCMESRSRVERNFNEEDVKKKEKIKRKKRGDDEACAGCCTLHGEASPNESESLALALQKLITHFGAGISFY